MGRAKGAVSPMQPTQQVEDFLPSKEVRCSAAGCMMDSPREQELVEKLSEVQLSWLSKKGAGLLLGSLTIAMPLSACTSTELNPLPKESVTETVVGTSTTIVATMTTADPIRIRDLESKIEQTESEYVAAVEADKILSEAVETELNQLANSYRQNLLDNQREIQCGYRLLNGAVLGYEGLATESRVAAASVNDLLGLADEIRLASATEWACGTPKSDRDTAFGWSVEEYYMRYRKGAEALWEKYIPKLIEQLSRYPTQASCAECYVIRDAFESEWEATLPKRVARIRNLSEIFSSNVRPLLVEKSESAGQVLAAKRAVEQAKKALIAYRWDADGSNSPVSSPSNSVSKQNSGGDSPRYVCGVGGCIDTWEPPITSDDQAVAIWCKDYATTAGCTISWSNGRKTVANPYAPRSGRVVNGAVFLDMAGNQICVDLYENGGIKTKYC